MFDSKPKIITVSILLSFLLGIYVHLTRLRHGEWDAESPRIVALATFVPIFISLWGTWLAADSFSFHDWSYFSSYLCFYSQFISFFLGIFSSMFIYRAYFHPLRRFPGPFWARVTMWWRVTATLGSSDRHAVMLDELHQSYGDVVRIGKISQDLGSRSAIMLT